MHDRSQPVEVRLQAARDLAPYVHRRQPVAVEIEGTGMPAMVMIVAPPWGEVAGDGGVLAPVYTAAQLGAGGGVGAGEVDPRVGEKDGAI